MNLFHSMSSTLFIKRLKSTLPNDIFIPGKYKKFIKDPKLPPKLPKLISPSSLNQSNTQFDRHDIKLMKHIHLNLIDILQTEPLPKELAEDIDIVHVELRPNKKSCLVFWRPFPDVLINQEKVNGLFKKYALVFQKLVGLRLSYGVQERQLPTLEFKFDQSGIMIEKLDEVWKKIDQENQSDKMK